MMFWRVDIDRFASTATADLFGDLLDRIKDFTNPLWRAGRFATPASPAGAEGDQPGLRAHA